MTTVICPYCKEPMNVHRPHMCAERKEAIFGDKTLKKKKSKQTPANKLTSDIIDYVIANGGAARRVNVSGRFIEGNPVKVPNGDRYKTLYTKGKWIKSGMLPGFEDISAIKPHGLYVAIEVKIGNDRLSQDQVLRRDEVERAGGKYIVARTFEQFKKEWEKI
jgi:hypothetical protein